MNTVRNARAQALVGQQRLQALQQASNRPGLLFFAGHLLLTFLTGTLLWFALDSNSLWIIILTTLLHGIVLVHWFAPCHECVHGSAFRTPWLNSLVGWLAGLIILIVPPYFKYEHVAHHAYTADQDRDPERIPQGETFWGYLYYASAIPYFRGTLDVLLRLPFGRFTDQERRFIPRRRLAEVQRATWIMWAVYGLIALISIWVESTAALTLWLLPRVVGEPFMRLIRMTEHVGCEQVPDMLHNTRTVITTWPLRVLAWNMCFHAEHHAFPRVPFHALPRLHASLGPHLENLTRGYPQAQLELARNGLANSGYLSRVR